MKEIEETNSVHDACIIISEARWVVTVAKKTVRDKQTCAGIANLKITGSYRLYRLFKRFYIDVI